MLPRTVAQTVADDKPKGRSYYYNRNLAKKRRSDVGRSVFAAFSFMSLYVRTPAM